MKDLFYRAIKIDFSCLRAKNLPENPLRVHEPLAFERKNYGKKEYKRCNAFRKAQWKSCSDIN